MTNQPLSPAAQAVLGAYEDSSMSASLDGVDRGGLAAALRAAADQVEQKLRGFSREACQEIRAIAAELGGDSKENERPDRLIAGDVWEFETEVMVKGKRKPQDVTLQCVVKGYHLGECAWQLQSLDGQHYVYLWEHAPQYEEMTYIGTQNND